MKSTKSMVPARQWFVPLVEIPTDPTKRRGESIPEHVKVLLAEWIEWTEGAPFVVEVRPGEGSKKILHIGRL